MAISHQTAVSARLHPEPFGHATGRLHCPVSFNHYIVPGTGGHGRARADALLAVTDVFACRVAVFGYDATHHDKFLIIFGEQPVLDALDLLLPKVALGMEVASHASAGAHANEVRAAQPDMKQEQRRRQFATPYFREHLRGYGAGAAEAISGLRSRIVATAGAELAESLAVQESRAEEAYGREFPDSPLLPAKDSVLSSAFLVGRDAGRAAGLDEEYAAQHDLVFGML
jgi:hypothetical protein